VRVVDVVNNELFDDDARVDKVIGSICDPNIMDSIIRGIDTVFHCGTSWISMLHSA
jgi:FlaA1/EpsC-like NDP-sugar epimerase